MSEVSTRETHTEGKCVRRPRERNACCEQGKFACVRASVPLSYNCVCFCMCGCAALNLSLLPCTADYCCYTACGAAPGKLLTPVLALD